MDVDVDVDVDDNDDVDDYDDDDDDVDVDGTERHEPGQDGTGRNKTKRDMKLFGSSFFPTSLPEISGGSMCLHDGMSFL